MKHRKTKVALKEFWSQFCVTAAIFAAGFPLLLIAGFAGYWFFLAAALILLSIEAIKIWANAINAAELIILEENKSLMAALGGYK